MNEILKSYKLAKHYEQFDLDSISFVLQKGTITGLVGPNGAGKSTTIKLLMNMIRPDSGTVSIFGLGYKDNEKEIKNRVGYVGEEQFYYEDKTVKWTGKFVSHFYSEWNDELFNKLLEKFLVSPSKKICELSKGMKVKLSLSIAMAHNPDLIILDEPTSGLDPVVRRELLDILQDFAEDENHSVIFSSHITEDLSRIADFLIFLVDGRIVLNGLKNEILSSYKMVKYKPDFDVTSLNLRNCSKTTDWGIGLIESKKLWDLELNKEINKGDIIVEDASIDDILISFIRKDV